MSGSVTYRVFIQIEREDTNPLASDEFLTTREECIGTFDGDDEHENAADAEALFDWVVKNS